MSEKTGQTGWQVVFATELRRLWLGWWGPLLLLVLSVLLSAYVLLLAIDPEMNVLSQRTMIHQTVQLTELVGIIAVLVLGADCISGERDRGSLEALLLTPLPRGQLVLGKLLALLSLWLGMIPIAAPYIGLVAKGTDVATASLILLAIPGTLLVGLSAAVGVLVSGLSPTNLLSFMLAFALMLLLVAPTQLPAGVQSLPLVDWLMLANPITAADRYQSTVVGGGAWTDGLGLLLSPLAAVVVAFGLGPGFLGRRLSLGGALRP